MKSIQILASGDLGGGELVGLNLGQSLIDRGFESEVWIPSHGAAFQESLKRGLRTFIFPLSQASSHVSSVALLGNTRFAFQVIMSRSDIVHFHSPFVYRMVRHGAKWSPARLVVHVHLETDEEGLKWALAEPPEIIVVCAEFLKDFVRRCLPEHSRDTQRIEVVSNAVNLECFYQGNKGNARTLIGIDSLSPFVLIVADLAPHKGQETVIKAIARLRQEGISVNCWLVGRARKGMESYEAHLRSLVTEMQVENFIYFAGHRSDVPLLMRAFDCLLLPSTREGLPLSIVEAHASGLPVIAAPTSGIPEVIQDGITGFLVEANDVEGYAEKIKTVLFNTEYRETIISNASIQCKRDRSWSAYVDKMIGVYRTDLQ